LFDRALQLLGVFCFPRRVPGEATLQNVAAFLLFSEAFPRSAALVSSPRGPRASFHFRSSHRSLFQRSRATDWKLPARINFSGIDEVFNRGLHAYIDELQNHLNDIGERLYETYVLLPSAIRNVTRTEGVQHQWQYQQQ